MKSSSLLLCLSLLLFLPACKESEITDKPAAEVSDATAATAPGANTTASAPAAAGPRTNVIKEKSRIDWVGAKVTRDHKGKFNDFDGWIEYARTAPSQISFDIDLTSIESDEPKLTEHLKSPDFFDVAKYPRATFVSTSITPAPGGSADDATHTLKGNLTMHGVTKELTIPVVAQQTAEGVRTTSQFTINRHDWGISYKGMADDLIKDDVLIKLDLSFPPPPAA